MRTFDLTPLYRSAIGFDRLVNMLEQRAEAAPSYPPYNVELVAEDKYRIVMALAGFARSEIEIVAERATLQLVARKQKADLQRHYRHRGIAQRDFDKRSQLANAATPVSSALANAT